MELAPDLVNAFLVIAMGGLITLVTRSQIQDVKNDIGEVKQEVRDLRAEVRDLRAEMNARFRDQDAKIEALRSDLTQLAIGLGTQPKPETA